MTSIRKYLPGRSAWQHMRFLFSFFLLPIFLFALSQVPSIDTVRALLTFVIWHLLVYPASNGYNSYFDRDEGSIALVEKPLPVGKDLYYFSLLLDAASLVLSVFVSVDLFVAVFLYGLFSKLYSHPFTRLKKYPVISFLIVFIFQGACIYWSSYAAISGLSVFYGWNLAFTLAGLICSCLIGASYPLTQVYQHDEDLKRGDRTLSILLGVRGSFWFAAMLFATATVLVFVYWQRLNEPANFWLFAGFALPVFATFISWFSRVRRDVREANFKNMSRMTWVSGTMMFFYFLLLVLRR